MKRILPLLPVLLGLITVTPALASADPVPTSINAFGLDLHRRLAATGGNLVTSPWSITSALAMTWGGAAGKTAEEMRAVLHLSGKEEEVHAGFARLAADLQAMAGKSQERVKAAKRYGGPDAPLEIHTANRLFGEQTYGFEKAYLGLTGQYYGAPLEPVDFRQEAEAVRARINGWVAGQTRDRIRDLVPAGAIDRDTRLVLTNAIFLKAPWAEAFYEEPDTPFFVKGTHPVKVPGLVRKDRFGYHKLPGGTAVTVPYADRGLHFVLLVPDERTGLPALEKNLTPTLLAGAAAAESREIILHFPAFKLEPGRVMLAKELIAMGMPTAFDQPQGSADFSGIAPRRPDDYLFISEVIHQAFIAVDKNGTEAAAATAVVMPRAAAVQPQPAAPLEVRIDRPFAFAIQHQPSATCLFLGRVSDPR